jgi:23S rRNA (cytidine1920-2'-O)/16S rRNA (cytidine1409-2'-O)-methyltransferase
VRENFNARNLTVGDLPERPSRAVTDVSFISLRLILPPMAEVLLPGGEMVSLVKPQFEAGREQVGKKGIVRDPDVHRQVIENVIGYGEENGLYSWGLTYSPVTGTKGNIEYLLFMKKQKCDNRIDVDQTVADSHSNLK